MRHRVSVSGGAPELLVVNYGPADSLEQLLRSIRRQTTAPSALRIWHNGPAFPAPGIDGTQVLDCGENVGFGEGINRLLEHVRADHVIVANPDLEFDARCLELLGRELQDHPGCAAVAAALATPGPERRVNAYGQRLTSDYLGVLADRGRDWESFVAAIPDELPQATERYLGPSGALFALNLRVWRSLGGGPLFPRSFFLYMEDVALWIRLRLAAAEIRFCPRAWATHHWSTSVGQRSTGKLFHVERNRLWLLRALRGSPRAALLLARTGLRYLAYLRTYRGEGAAANGAAGALARAISEGLGRPVPSDIHDYFRGCDASRLPRSFFATLREELASPVP